MTDPLVLAVAIPIAGSVATFLARGRFTALLGVVATLLTWLTAAALAGDVAAGGARRYALGGWGAPLGIDLYVDGLAAAMIAMTSTVGVLVSIYAWASFDRQSQAGRLFWPLWLIALTAMHALFLSADLFNLYVTLELLGIAAAALVILAGGAAGLMSGTRYLFAAYGGSMAFLMGVALLFAETGTLDLYALGAVEGPVPAVALALMTGGLLLKTGLFPFHFWLPPAHAIAPSAVSAVLSGLVVKASLYLLLRLWLQGLPGVALPLAAQVLGLLGTSAVVWGSLAALRQQRLKLLIAYSTVAQLGYVLLLLPIATGGAGSGQSAAWTGAFYYMLSHAVAKAALFLAAGVMLRSLGHDRIDELHAMAAGLPIAAFAFGVAGISLAGLPPTGGFVGKWYLVQASIVSGQWWWAVALVGGGLLTVGYLLRAMRHFLAQGDSARYRPVPAAMQWASLALALVAVLLGLRGAELIELLHVGAPFGGTQG